MARGASLTVLVAAMAAAALPAAASAAPTVTLSADQTLVRNGTTVNFTLTVTKSPTADHGGINFLIDSLDGPITAKAGRCILSPNAPDLSLAVPSYSCTYPFVVDGRGGTTQTHTMNAIGVETFCGAPPPTPGAPCPATPPASDVAFNVISNPVTVTLRCKKGQKLRKGKCRKR